MGHSLGQLNDRLVSIGYFRGGYTIIRLWADRYVAPSDSGDDQMCGRLLAGLEFTSINFAALPPHFPIETLLMFTPTVWDSIYPGYGSLPQTFKPVMTFLVASIIFHEQYLRETLNESHPIFKCGVFEGNPILDDLRTSVLTGIAKCPVTGMSASGTDVSILCARGKLLYIQCRRSTAYPYRQRNS
jgi:hypothetical protein